MRDVLIDIFIDSATCAIGRPRRATFSSGCAHRDSPFDGPYSSNRRLQTAPITVKFAYCARRLTILGALSVLRAPILRFTQQSVPRFRQLPIQRTIPLSPYTVLPCHGAARFPHLPTCNIHPDAFAIFTILGRWVVFSPFRFAAPLAFRLRHSTILPSRPARFYHFTIFSRLPARPFYRL